MPRFPSSLFGRSVIALAGALASTALVTAAPARAQEAPPATAAPAQEEPTASNLPRTVEQVGGSPQGDLPPPPPRGQSRTVSLGLAVGPGWLALRDDLGRDGQSAMGFAGRVAVVVAPEWTFVLGVDRTSTDRGGATFSQTAALLGVQRFFLGRLYLGAAGGMAWVAESGVPDGLTDGPGVALSATVGVEVIKRSYFALTAELTVTGAHYRKEAWEMGGVRLGLVAF